MTTVASVSAVGLLLLVPAAGYSSADIAGTWNVVSVQDGPYSCSPQNVSPGSTNAYIWIVSVDRDGSVSVSVQGETAFEELSGYWNQYTEEMTLTGYDSGLTWANSCWFHLELRGDELVGVRRYMGKHNNFPFFIDYSVTATR